MLQLPIGQFDRVLSRHLVQLLKEGLPCNEELIREGYKRARRELSHPAARSQDPIFKEIEQLYVEHDREAIARFELVILQMPNDQASALIYKLLRDEAVVVQDPLPYVQGPDR
jgi:hypothetical protein